ncbi:hypothetical protein B0T24DRAFT_624361 [Lasiosphaeria ovina]|uniref:Uncharacterized protein n=1 Tax=Lasiosphaeria ovina TaxID=92902 RepID=A0AAE0KCN4_9PEZI|nr:hypothetical protein B0T24DRAFT_624361 [Lasiosphaeria ovina]
MKWSFPGGDGSRLPPAAAAVAAAAAAALCAARLTALRRILPRWNLLHCPRCFVGVCALVSSLFRLCSGSDFSMVLDLPR